MADVGCDEEVLLENSPLSQYLKEACPELQFETVSAAGGERTKTRPASTRRNFVDSVLVHLDRLKGIIHQVLEWTFPPVSESVQDLNDEFLPQYSSLVLDTGLLLDVDRQTIQAYCPRRSQDTPHQALSHQRHSVWLSGRLLCALAVLCTVLAVFLRDASVDSAKECGLSYAHAIFCFAVLLSSIAYAFHWTRACWIVNGLRTLHKKSIECTGQCLRLLDQQGGLLRKSIRYVQEVEVISRGFTMVSTYTPVVRLESATSSKQRQCIVLRKACFFAARAQFNALRGATLRLMKQHPLVTDIDHVTNYLAMVRLEDTAPWIEVADDDIEDEFQDSLSELTGCYSLAALKAMNSLFLEQRSEFIRRLVLCTCQDARPEPQMTAGALSSWLRIVQDVGAACEASLGKLQRSYDCHRQRPSQHRDRTPTDRLPQGGGEMQPQLRVGSAVRSLRLHLEATLNRVISVEEALEGRDQHQASRDETVWTLTTKMLDAVKRELTASQDCLLEATALLEKMNSISSKHTRKDVSVGVQQSNTDTDSREPILLLPVRDTEIEFDDQIFEAYTDTEPGERDDEEWGEGISDAEKIRRRREAEETKRMLQELRSVLSVRKAERERMKSERSLATKRAKNSISPSDTPTADSQTATRAVGTEDKPAGREIAEKQANAVDTSSEKAGNTALADRELSSGKAGDLTMSTCQDVRSSDSRDKSEHRTCGFSRDVCNDTPDGRMVNRSSDVGENAPVTSKKPVSLVSAQGSSITAESKCVGDPKPRASSLNEGGSMGDLQTINTNRAPGFDVVRLNQSQDDPGHLEKNQSTGEDSDTVTGRSPFNPTQGQTQFGLSFLPSLAAEAARKSRQCRQEEETFIGGDEESSESEEMEEVVQG